MAAGPAAHRDDGLATRWSWCCACCAARRHRHAGPDRRRAGAESAFPPAGRRRPRSWASGSSTAAT
ncbi:MAG: DUF4603 domain-containing protein [Comamonadaceae bacterium]|nr:DUF4603 domain-containing protein [Comamonadaceae bacterium]